MSLSGRALGALVSVAALGIASAQAAVFEFSYSTIAGGILTSSGAGTLTSTPEGGGVYLVTSATGTLDGSALSLIAPGGYFSNDNLLHYPADPFLDFAGISFEAGGMNYNFYYDNGTFIGPGYAVCTPCGIGNATLFAGTLTPIPEPATWGLMALGFGGLGLIEYRVRRRLQGA